MVGAMGRASPLPASERRAAIMAATERLLTERGKSVSTREIADAAGIAEGTIFRVFPTKESIIDAIFEEALDPRPGWERMKAIDPSADLETRLVELVSQIQHAIGRMMSLFAAVGFRQPRTAPDVAEMRTRGIDAIAEVLQPHAAELRTDPHTAARLVHGLAVSLTHPMLIDKPIGDPRQIVDLALRGIAHPAAKANS
jgi:AcrR family transcriptional regulator